MVMILRKSLDAQAADSVAGRSFDSELRPPKKMSHGPTLFSRGVMENDRWRDLDRECPLQIDPPSASLWGRLPERCPDGTLWHPEAAAAGTVTSLIQDLSLSDRHGNPAAPPSKRQCRSLSFSDEMSSCRTSWRPLGSRRSSSFSLPSRADALASPCDPAGFPRHLGGQACPGAPGAATCGQGDLWSPDRSPAGGARLDMQRSLSCSHEQFAFAEFCAPSACSTPASTPELARRPGGLARSRSQPCVLNDKKVGVKRRRPEEGPEPRPSLDLAKMAQRVAASGQARHGHSFPGGTAHSLSARAALPAGPGSFQKEHADSVPGAFPLSLGPPTKEEVQDLKSKAHP
ncbi:hypothetical protein QTO34_005755 [Cnephaeus nilssonii]|uniref:Protein FAM53B n=1 Tax=Cnephaeus nilssonii TaxID=3371016 RepID=A0AA40HM63_CNENI|nr:hypothetical protein QTO34_005755 [Eptesicus nilssonii]